MTGTTIDPVFGHARPKAYGRGKRRRMKEFQITEISAVDSPAQKGAVATLMKRRTPVHELHVDYDRALADVTRFRKAGDHKRAETLSRALDLHAHSIIMKNAKDQIMLKAMNAPASASAGSFMFEDEMDKGEDEQEEYLEELDETDKAELEADEVDLDQLEADELDSELTDEIMQTAQGSDPDDPDTLFTNETEIGTTANNLMRRDPRLGKRRALLMAAGRRAYAKMASRITTDSREPFHQVGAAQRRAEMDQRARDHRNAANAEIEAMHSGVVMGREMEERRRLIDGAVMKLRTVNKNMPYTAALRKVRQAYLQIPAHRGHRFRRIADSVPVIADSA